MKLIALALLLPAIANTALADPTQDLPVEKTSQPEPVLDQPPAVAETVELEPERQQPPAVVETVELEPERQQPQAVPSAEEAYAALGKALAEHPEMAVVNHAESRALKAYQGALPGGNPVELSITRQALAKAKAARYQKALSIPELKLAIETWQQAVADAEAANSNSAKVISTLDTLHSKLKELSQAIAR